jgi:hypothetical protein
MENRDKVFLRRVGENLYITMNNSQKASIKTVVVVVVVVVVVLVVVVVVVGKVVVVVAVAVIWYNHNNNNDRLTLQHTCTCISLYLL